jgi:glutathione S-transferase
MTVDGSLITGLYEAHLPTEDLDRAVAFYERLGLAVAYRNERVAFVWLEPGRSWIGLWGIEAPEAHVAFEAPVTGLERSVEWLSERDIDPVEVNGFTEPQVRPYQANASVYFEDPFGNSLELMCSLPVEPTETRGEHPSLAEWLAENREAVESAERGDGGGAEARASGTFITGLNEAHLPVDDVEAAVAFYEGVLGLPVAWRADDMAFVWVEPGRSWLGLWERGLPEHHVAYEVSLDNLARSEAWLAERGVELREVSGFAEPFVRPHQPIGSAYFSDSEENNVELLSFLPVEPTDAPEKVPLRAWLSERE